jgi:hypothetical protein
MKDITIIALDSKCDRKILNKEGGSFSEPLSAICCQLNSLNISYSIIRTSIDRIPNSVESNLVTFVDLSLLVKEDYIFNAVTLNNLHRDMGIIFGPISIDANSDKNVKYIKNSYHGYDLNFGGIYTADITDEPHNYGSLYNAVIAGSVYNRIGFSGCSTPRSFILDNTAFFRQVSKTNKIYYTSLLHKTKILTDEDFEHKVVSDYYYNVGYLDGVSASWSGIENQRHELWKRFVESPEVIDSSHPRWLFDEPRIKENLDYLELLTVLKCKYQIGYFEGMLGKKII